MTDPTPEADAPVQNQTRGLPRWVKVSLLVVVALVALAVLLNLLGVPPGSHGPGRHMPGGTPDHGPAMHDR